MIEDKPEWKMNGQMLSLTLALTGAGSEAVQCAVCFVQCLGYSM